MAASAIAQQHRYRNKRPKSYFTRSVYKSKTTLARGRKANLACPVFESSSYPYHGLGFKLGDPFALTYKFYPNKNFSLAFDVGKASSGLYNRYFREKFPLYLSEIDTLSANASATYSSHQVQSDIIYELKLLYNIDASKVSPGLQIYIGGGWEWKNTRLKYGYIYKRTDPVTGSDLQNQFRTFSRKRSTMGPQVVLGVEYAYFQIPIAAFMELEYFSDMQADPGWRRFEGGVGLRYIF
jgi:hypothetical protein